MTIEKYNAVIGKLRENKKAARAVVTVNKTLTAAVYCIYPVMLVLLFLCRSPLLIRTVSVPAAAFLLISILRYFINAPRPYEQGVTPLIRKKTVGKSFPSRHTFSIFIIAFVSFPVNVYLGILLTFFGIILAVCRVLCGLHFIKDVVCGTLFAFVSFLIGLAV